MDVTGSSPGSLRRQVDSPSFTGGGAAVRADDLPRWSAPAPSAALAWGRVGDRLPPRCRPLGSLLALARGGTDPRVDPSADGPASAPSNCYRRSRCGASRHDMRSAQGDPPRAVSQAQAGSTCLLYTSPSPRD